MRYLMNSMVPVRLIVSYSAVNLYDLNTALFGDIEFKSALQIPFRFNLWRPSSAYY